MTVSFDAARGVVVCGSRRLSLPTLFENQGVGPVTSIVAQLDNVSSNDDRAAVQYLLNHPTDVAEQCHTRLALRLVEALWEFNESNVTRRDLVAVVRQAHLAQRRYEMLRRAWLSTECDDALGGDESVLYLRMQESRRGWARLLADAHRRLAHDEEDVEAAARKLAFTDDGQLLASGRQLPEVVRKQREPVEFRVQAGLAERLFLPRFMLGDVVRQTGNPRLARFLIAAVPGVQGLTATLLVAFAGGPGGLTAAAAVAGACYLAVAFITLTHAEMLAALCLRLPATTAIGLSGLLTFGSSWLQRPRPASWLAVPALLAAAVFGYLLVELRGAGVTERAAVVRRSVLVLTMGVGYAIGVTVMLYATVGRYLNGYAGGLGAGGIDRLANLLMAAISSLALGIFLQILWEDRPVTYPVAGIGSLEVD